MTNKERAMPSCFYTQTVSWTLLPDKLVFILSYFVSISFSVPADELSDLLQWFPGRINLPERQKGSCRAEIKVKFTFALTMPWPVRQ